LARRALELGGIEKENEMLDTLMDEQIVHKESVDEEPSSNSEEVNSASNNE